jgi:uncharacterized protein YcbK (DUF882 family)
VGSFVVAGFARQFNALSKAGYRAGLTSLLLLMGAGSVHDAAALNETRTLSFHHTHSDEDLTVTFKRDGRYDEDALKLLNHFLRDWRSQEQTTMDRHLFDILWEVYRDVDGKKPIQIISSYRSPATNAMLHRRSSGVARFSQHMLGHAMDFYIPDVSLEQIRIAGLRLQRGGVGFYPTSGSPFVHLDTGGIRHWPRMTHDQLARVFPDGRTVHVPSDGNPLKGYELARADIESRGSGDASSNGLSALFSSLFKVKSNDDEDEGSITPVAKGKPGPDAQLAAAVRDKSADPVPVPRAKPAAATIQLASADVQIVQIVQAAKTKPEAGTTVGKAEAKPQTPADIINARGFWGDAPAGPTQASPAQAAAAGARQALASADPQPTASVSAAFQALAYAPASSQVERSSVVAASAPIPRSIRSVSAPRNPNAATTIDMVVAKGPQVQGKVVAPSTRLASFKGNDTWMRVMILAPSASTSMSTTVLGNTDMTVMRAHFVKPQAVIAISFSNDPQMGMVSDRFTGSATAGLATQSLVMRTASLH